MFAINKVPIKPLMLASAGVAFAALLLTTGLAWRVTTTPSSSAVSEHHREITTRFDSLTDQLERAEDAQWIYFLTKENRSLQHHDTAVEQLNLLYQQLITLTSDNAIQQQRLLQAKEILDQHERLFAARLNVRDVPDAVLPLYLIEHRHDATLAVRQIVREANKDEDQMLAAQRSRELFRQKVLLSSIAILLATLILLALYIQHLMRHFFVNHEHDVEQQRQPLLKAEALQSAIFNNPNFSFIATDAQGIIQVFNVGAEHMLGYKAVDVVNKMMPSGISDEDELIARADALSLELNTKITPGFNALVFKASRGIEDIYELTYIRSDGTRFPVIVSVTALRDEVAKVIGYLLISTDNTIRKQVEAEQALLDQRLRDQQFYTRSLIEANIDAIMTTDPQGIISDVNQQTEALTGCTREELIGRLFKNCFTDPERAKDAITRALHEGKVTNYELTARAKDGTETVVSYNATTFYDRERKLQGVVAAARDMTELKKFEHALQENNIELAAAKANAEKANSAKSDFLSSMSHELRTPLNAVLGFAQLMESETPSPTPAQKLSIEQILQAGWYLLRLINEILDLSMIESGKVTISQESMCLNDIFQDCQLMMEPQASKRRIQMTFPGTENLFYVYADRTRVKQVLINLLSNAIKYNRDDGAVIVQCQMNGENRIRISVRDTGAGLAENQLGKLFQPFNRLGKESGPEEGTGIGLVVTKQLVELMGGTIGVESMEDVGSTFWFELIASKAPSLVFGEMGSGKTNPVIKVKEPDPVVSTAQKSLLYVEDNPTNMELIRQLITRRDDLKLLAATDAHIGIQMARSFRPDVILMDINLPGLNGYDALKILHSDRITKDIPVMALSANALPRDIKLGLDAGFFLYLTKPISVSEFTQALHDALAYAADQHVNKGAGDL
ncbi:PAS domain S-box protein [Undibacterium sp. 14-3-2]|uniref:PAS domain S-box protein n=1 Tax=Undibacterium sp. 14-3-2 TaxID=2800129 RepID=UPI001902E8BB|nr:PAS domain S-box protein [Undibacterium sp. 14-3-2]MBK1889225.1 PAS domain S-box protein [Undibacterium sp. 14-3-2]